MTRGVDGLVVLLREKIPYDQADDVARTVASRPNVQAVIMLEGKNCMFRGLVAKGEAPAPDRQV